MKHQLQQLAERLQDRMNFTRLALVVSLAFSLLTLSPLISPARADESDVSWEMPDARNLSLQRALEGVREVTGGVELNIDIEDRKNNQMPINLTNWIVCAQYPDPGDSISREKKYVILVVKRPTSTSCS